VFDFQFFFDRQHGAAVVERQNGDTEKEGRNIDIVEGSGSF
jgi:hypothetical protein